MSAAPGYGASGRTYCGWAIPGDKLPAAVGALGAQASSVGMLVPARGELSPRAAGKACRAPIPQAFEDGAHRLRSAAVSQRIQQRGGCPGALYQALRIRQHDRVVPGPLDHEWQLECG